MPRSVEIVKGLRSGRMLRIVETVCVVMRLGRNASC